PKFADLATNLETLPDMLGVASRRHRHRPPNFGLGAPTAVHSVRNRCTRQCKLRSPPATCARSRFPSDRRHFRAWAEHRALLSVDKCRGRRCTLGFFGKSRARLSIGCEKRTLSPPLRQPLTKNVAIVRVSAQLLVLKKTLWSNL